MLEHADRNDPVERARRRSDNRSARTSHGRRRPRLRRAARATLSCSSDSVIAEHVDARDLVQIKRHPAPAAADVEHALAGLEVELGGDMRLLVGLRLLEAVGRIGEVSAAVLQVVVEEERVEVVADVVMVGDVAARLAQPGCAGTATLELAGLALAQSLAARRPPPTAWRRRPVRADRGSSRPRRSAGRPCRLRRARRRGLRTMSKQRLAVGEADGDLLAAARSVAFARLPSGSTTVMLPRSAASLSTSRADQRHRNPPSCGSRTSPLPLRRSLQLAAGGVDVAAARRAHRRRNARFEDDVAERPDPLVGRTFVGRAGPRVERDQIDLGRQAYWRISRTSSRASSSLSFLSFSITYSNVMRRALFAPG